MAVDQAQMQQQMQAAKNGQARSFGPQIITPQTGNPSASLQQQAQAAYQGMNAAKTQQYNGTPAPMSGVGGIGVQNPGAPGTGFGPDASQMQTPSAAPDAAAIRRRLMGSTPGSEGAAGQPWNSSFDNTVSGLYATLGQKLAGYDQNEGQLRSDYEKNRGAYQQQQGTDMSHLMDRLAFQGILSSGITTDQRAQLGQRYSTLFDNLASKEAAGLNSIQTGRLGAQGDYTQGLGKAENDYTTQLSNWVQSQAQQQAQRQQTDATNAANNSILQQLQALQASGNTQQLDLLRQIAAAQGVQL